MRCPVMTRSSCGFAPRLDNPAAFAPLYERYATPVYRLCLRACADPDLADDLTAKVFITVLNRLSTYQPRPGATFRAWLYTVARNVVADHWRRYRPSPRFDIAKYDFPAPAPGPEEHVIASSELDRLLGMVDALPDRQRAIIELCLFGLNSTEIAAVLGISRAAVKSAQTRAYRTLREGMRGEERPS